MFSCRPDSFLGDCVFHCKRKRPAVICFFFFLKWKAGGENERQLLVKYCQEDRYRGAWLILVCRWHSRDCAPYTEGWPQLLQESGGPHPCLQTRGGSCLWVLFLFEEKCHKEMVAVVARWSPPKPPVGKLRTHAHLHTGSKLLALKGREQSLKDSEETTAPEHVLGTIRLLGAFQLPYRVKGLRRVQSDGPSQQGARASLWSPWMDGLMSWWQIQLPYPSTLNPH